MSIKTEESLNCPCSGIYTCGFHSVPKKIFLMSTPKTRIDSIIKEYNNEK